MCGRFYLTQPRHELEQFFGVKPERDFNGELQPKYNLPPTEQIPGASIDKTGEMRLDLYRWGLIPSWADLSNFKATTINARAESVTTKPMYRSAFISRRLLIPADGFYEWDRTNPKAKQPYAFARKDGEPMAFAGLWEGYKHPEGQWIHTCTILTTANNSDMPIHNRLPLILERDNWERWLDSELTDQDELEGMIHVAQPGILRHYPVDRSVGSVKIDNAGLIEPIELDVVQTLL